MSRGRENSSKYRLSLLRLRKVPRGLVLRAVAASVAAGLTGLPALAQLASPTYVTGGANATITVTFTVAPVAGATVSCSLSLISSDPRGPSDTNSTSATVNGSTATCQIAMHFNWRLTSSSLSTDMMTIAYSVDGPVQSSSGLVNILPMPANGTQLNLAIAVTQ